MPWTLGTSQLKTPKFNSSVHSSAITNKRAWRDRLPAWARNVKVRLPKNCTEAPAHSAGKRAAVGVMPIKRMQAENNEKSTRVAPLPTINARAKRSARSDQRSRALTFC